MKLTVSDINIIESLKSCNDADINNALRLLYRKYHSMALHLVRTNNGAEDDAADVFQEALIALYQNLRRGTFRGESTLKTYLYGMIKNQWMSRLQSNNREIIMKKKIHSIKLQQFQPTHNKHDDLPELIDEILSQLSDRCKTILKLYYWDKFSMREIAGKLGLDNENSAKSQKYKCMQRLIRILSEKPCLKNDLKQLLAEIDKEVI